MHWLDKLKPWICYRSRTVWLFVLFFPFFSSPPPPHNPPPPSTWFDLLKHFAGFASGLYSADWWLLTIKRYCISDLPASCILCYGLNSWAFASWNSSCFLRTSKEAERKLLKCIDMRLACCRAFSVLAGSSLRLSPQCLRINIWGCANKKNMYFPVLQQPRLHICFISHSPLSLPEAFSLLNPSI